MLVESLLLLSFQSITITMENTYIMRKHVCAEARNEKGGLSPYNITKVVRYSNSTGRMTQNDKFMRTSAGISAST